MRDAWRVAPQQIDPLSWFTRPLVPIAFATVIAVYGAGTILIEISQIAMPALDFIAVLLMASACVFVQVRTRPYLGRFGRRHVSVAIALCLAGLALSTRANLESTLMQQYWWAPVGVAVVAATLAPFSSVRRILCYGSILILATAAAGMVGFQGVRDGWPPVSSVVVVASTVVVGVAASAVFSYIVVSGTLALLKDRVALENAGGRFHDDAVERVERYTVARLGARVAPFLEGVAAAGTVTQEDRALAGQLARRLRSDLVERSGRTWLDRVADRGRIFVVDPQRRADQMNHAQRSALRGLLTVALRQPGADAGSLFIELRGQPDGATAVALSLDINLPEGRRAMLIAPYYLTLQTAVSDLTYDASRDLLRFEVRAD